MSLEQKKVVLPVKNMGEVANAQSKIMGTVTKFMEVNYVAVDKDKVTITTFPNSKIEWDGVDIQKKLSEPSYGFDIHSPEEGTTTYVGKNENTKDVINGSQPLQEVVLKIHCEETQSEAVKRTAMTTITLKGGVKFIGIADDSNKKVIVMRFRGTADVVVRSLLKLASTAIRFTVSTVSPLSKPNQQAEKKDEEKKKEPPAKADDKKSNKDPQFYNVEYKTTSGGNGDTETFENAMRILADTKGVHSISMEDAPKLLMIAEAQETTNIRSKMKNDKRLSKNFKFVISKPMNNKPQEKKDQGNDEKKKEKKDEGNDEKKKIIVKLDYMKLDKMDLPDASGRVMENLGKVEGLESIYIEPAERKLLTVTGSANVVDVLKALFAVKRLKACIITIVSVGPNKKEEAKKKEEVAKKTNPAPPPPTAAPVPGIYQYPQQNNFYPNLWAYHHNNPYNQSLGLPAPQFTYQADNYNDDGNGNACCIS